MADSFAHGYAVIIGVDENSLPRLALPAVAKDVQAVYDVLTHPQRCSYAPENVKLYHGADATRDNIFEAFLWIQDKIEEDPDATAVVYYSGHGMVDNQSNQYYLIPYDVGEMRRIRQRAIRAQELGAEIAALQPQRLLAILDCCHAAGMDVKDVDLDQPVTPAAFPLDLPETKDIPALDAGAKDADQLATGSGRAVLNSSTGAESSYIREDRTMSVFTYYLIEALTGHAPYDEGDTTVLVTDVMSYVTRRVAETAQKEGRQQTPVMRTTGVFPVALLLGGKGVAKGMAPPDPLEELPSVAPAGTQVSVEGSGAAAVGEGATAVGERGVNVGGDVGGDISTGDTNTIFNQQGQTVHGPQVQAGRDANIGQIGDNINTGGGDYVGGNKTVNQGDTYSGDFRGAILNVRSTLSDVTNTIGALPAADDDAKAELKQLIAQLETALARTVEAAPEKADEAEAVSDMTESLVNTASSEKPNKTLVQVTGDGLKQAARNLADVTPAVLDIASRIVTVVAAFAA